MARLFSSNDACGILLHQLVSWQADVYATPNESFLVSIYSINILSAFPAYLNESKVCILYVFVHPQRKLLHGF
jgi:hypothetical protein